MTDLWRPVGSRAVLHARVIAEIERLIEARHLQPLDRLPPERELAGLLQVGRSSLREAIAVLSARGLLQVKRGHGIYVARPPLPSLPSLDDDGLRQLFDMREVIEVAAAGWAAEQATAEDIASLNAAIHALASEATASRPDLERLQELDTNFHLLVASMARNRFLEQMTHLLHGMLAAGMEASLPMPGRVSRSRRSHVRVARAIARHDAAAARAAMAQHIKEVKDAVGSPVGQASHEREEARG